jgi:thiol-disulfide isomerase/thioredoxin
MSARGLSESYPATTALGIYTLEPSPDGDRLTICFAIRGGSRPTEFKYSDGARLATFVRAAPGFKSLPGKVVVTVLDPGGKPDPGAGIFHYMDKGGFLPNGKFGQTPESYDDVAKTGSDGTATLGYEEFENAAGVPGGAHDDAHHWIGFARVSPAALRNGTLTIRMQPPRTIRGMITSDALTKAGKQVPYRYAYLFPFENRIAWCLADTGSYEFPAPPGEYKIYVYGNDLIGREERISVSAGTGDFVVPVISLEPSKILTVIGDPAPPLRDVLAWKNGAADFGSMKGKVILLDFWGYWCGNCVEEMPELIRVYDKFKSQGLTVASVHVDDDGEVDTVAKLDEKTAMYRQRYWGGRDIPFPTALIAGGMPGDYRCRSASDYGAEGYPTTIVIGRDGRIMGQLGDQVRGQLTGDEAAIDAGIERLLKAG